jgi:hypothetical protein
VHIVLVDQRVERRRHVPHPGVTLGIGDDERRVAHPQPGMTPLVGVGGRPSPVLRQEQRQVPPRLAQVVGIEGPEQQVGGHPVVEPVDQLVEEVHAPDDAVDGHRPARRDLLGLVVVVSVAGGHAADRTAVQRPL